MSVLLLQTALDSRQSWLYVCTVKRTGESGADVRNSYRRPGVRLIAESLGVSIATVDRALHDRPDVNPLTKARVLKMAEELGYRPNLAARFLARRTPLRITAVLPREIEFFFGQVRSGIEQAAHQYAAAGLHVEFQDYPLFGVGEVEAVERALAERPKGLIVAPGMPGALKPLIRKASRARIPVVCVNTDAPGSGRLATVSMDPVLSGSTVAELIGRFSHRRGKVALITGSMETTVHRRQVEAFSSTVAELFPDMQVAAILEAHDLEEEAYREILATVRPEDGISAVYVTTANSLGVLRGLGDLGLLGTITVVTTDLFPQLARYIESGSVTATVYQRPKTQGRIAMEMLFRFLAEGVCPATTVELAPHIVMRSNLKRFLETLGSATTAAHNGQ